MLGVLKNQIPLSDRIRERFAHGFPSEGRHARVRFGDNRKKSFHTAFKKILLSTTLTKREKNWGCTVPEPELAGWGMEISLYRQINLQAGFNIKPSTCKYGKHQERVSLRLLSLVRSAYCICVDLWFSPAVTMHQDSASLFTFVPNMLTFSISKSLSSGNVKAVFRPIPHIHLLLKWLKQWKQCC